MQVQFNRPITLGTTTYGKGQHTVPDAEAAGWYFEALVKDGVAVVLRQEGAPQFEPVQEKRKPGRPPKVLDTPDVADGAE